MQGVFQLGGGLNVGRGLRMQKGLQFSRLQQQCVHAYHKKEAKRGGFSDVSSRIFCHHNHHNHHNHKKMPGMRRRQI